MNGYSCLWQTLFPLCFSVGNPKIKTISHAPRKSRQLDLLSRRMGSIAAGFSFPVSRRDPVPEQVVLFWSIGLRQGADFWEVKGQRRNS